jgi:hypothetical protein
MRNLPPIRSLLIRLVAFLLLGGLPTATQAAETVVFHLRNGDRITGEVVSRKSDAVVVRSLAGKVRIPLDLIERREEKVPPAVVATPKPASPAAKPAPTPASGVVKSTPPPAVDIRTNLASLGENPWYRPGWIRPLLTNWNVNIQLGSDLGFGTTDRQTFYGNASAIHRWDRVRNSATASAAYGVLNGFDSANRLDGSLKTDIDLGSRRKVYAFNLAGAGFDHIRRLDLQYQEGAGFGYKLLEKPRFILNAELGAQYQQFDFVGTSRDRDLISVRFGEDLTWELSSKLKIRQTLAFMPNITDFGDFRAQYTLNFSYPLLKRTTLNLNIIDLYDTNPVIGVNNNDLTIQTTLGISF